VGRLNQQAADFAALHHLAGTAGSDAHTPREVGRASLTLPYFDSADGLRAVIRQGKLEGRLSSPWIHLTSTYARLYKRMRGKK